jgi:protein involved in polysaccharide export with SLBB domain
MFSIYRSDDRQRVVKPLLEELQLQARFGEPFREVSISGQVPAPGTFPLEQGMRVSDLLRAGGGLSEEAYALKAEIARYDVVNGEYRDSIVMDVDLESILGGSESADLTLQEHDNLRISTIPKWDTLWTVTLEGEVKFAGEYRIRRGETLRQVLERAGGLTDAAFPEGAIFLREALKEREQEQIEVLARRLEADLTSLSLQSLETHRFRSADDRTAAAYSVESNRSNRSSRYRYRAALGTNKRWRDCLGRRVKRR